MEFAVNVQDVSYSYGPIQVLNQVNLTVPRGIIYGLLGPSGSGKTTLIRLIAGALRTKEGAIQVLGASMPSRDTAARIGYMTQGAALYTDLSLRENLRFFGDLYGIDRASLDARVSAMAETVELSPRLNSPLNEFSGGMLQRSSLAAALLHDPDVLLLDEPTVGLDPVLRHTFWSNFRELAAQGKSLLVSSHIMDEADRCDQLAFVRDGRILVTGTPASIRQQAGVSSLEDAFLRLSGNSSELVEGEVA